MALDPKKVFVAPSLPKSSRTQAQRDATAGKSGDGISSKQFLSLNKSIFAINKNLNAIADLIKEKAQADADSDRDDKLRRDRDADAKKKGAAEKMLEGVLSNAVVKPLKTIQKTTSNIFEKLFKALGSLFMGYVGMKGIEGLKDWLEGDRSTLKGLARDVGLVLTAAAGVFAAITFAPIISSLGSLIFGMTGAMPGIFAALGNPYLWLGIMAATAVVYTGTELYKYLRGEYGGSLSGRDSFVLAQQDTVDKISVQGVDATYNEYDARLRKLAKLYPHYFYTDKKGELQLRSYAKVGELGIEHGEVNVSSHINDLRRNMEHMKAGRFNKFDPTKLGDNDKKAWLLIEPLVLGVKKDWEQFVALATTLQSLYMDPTSATPRMYTDLEDWEKKEADIMMEKQAKLKESFMSDLKKAHDIKNGMSWDAQDLVDGIFSKAGIKIFQNATLGNVEGSTGWMDTRIQPGPILSPDQQADILTTGTSPKVIEMMNKLHGAGMTLTTVPVQNLAPRDPATLLESSNDSNNTISSANNGESTLKQEDINSTVNAFKTSNGEVASLINSSSFVNDQKFDFVPIDLSSNAGSSFGSEAYTSQNYDPSIFNFSTSNAFNDEYIALFESQIGVYSDE